MRGIFFRYRAQEAPNLVTPQEVPVGKRFLSAPRFHAPWGTRRSAAALDGELDGEPDGGDERPQGRPLEPLAASDPRPAVPAREIGLCSGCAADRIGSTDEFFPAPPSASVSCHVRKTLT